MNPRWVRRLDQLARLLPGLWAGLLLCVAFVATPAPFATLATADAGRVVARIFAVEAPISLLAGGLLLVWARRHAAALVEAGTEGATQFSPDMMLALGAVFCTVAGYYGLQPAMAAARAGNSALSFGQWHAISLGLFALKGLLVLALAWRTTR